MNVLVELREKCRDLAASDMSTTLRVLKFCHEPGGVCDKRIRRPSLAKEKKIEYRNSLQSPRKSLSKNFRPNGMTY
jgi:hypothetical protein